MYHLTQVSITPSSVLAAGMRASSTCRRSTRVTDSPCSWTSQPAEHKSPGFFQPLDFSSEERDRIILLLVLESWESLKNSFKLLVIYHSEPNLEKLHSKARYFSQKLKVKFFHTSFPSYLYSFLFPFLFTPYSLWPVWTQCQRITGWVPIKIQYKVMTFAWSTSSHSQNHPFQMLNDTATSFSM